MSNTSASNENKVYYLRTKTAAGMVIVNNGIIHKTVPVFGKWKGRELNTVTKILKNKRELLDIQECVPEEISTYVDDMAEENDNL